MGKMAGSLLGISGMQTRRIVKHNAALSMHQFQGKYRGWLQGVLVRERGGTVGEKHTWHMWTDMIDVLAQDCRSKVSMMLELACTQ